MLLWYYLYSYPLRYFQLLFQSQNPGIEFEYTVSNENATDRRIPEFYWKYLPWTHCTVSCGGGETPFSKSK
jgi:thrombospondin motif-containing protein 7/thrombospondin motif-containing protein 12